MLRVPAPLSRQCPPVPEPLEGPALGVTGTHTLPPTGFGVSTPGQRERERMEISRVGWGDAGAPRPQHRGPSRGIEDGGGCHGPHPGPALRGSVLFIPRPAPGVGPEPPPRDPAGVRGTSPELPGEQIPHGHGPAPHGGGPARALSVHPPPLHHRPSVTPPPPSTTKRPARRGRSQPRRCPRLTHILRPRPRRFPAPPPTARGGGAGGPPEPAPRCPPTGGRRPTGRDPRGGRHLLPGAAGGRTVQQRGEPEPPAEPTRGM
ncbi:proline-rich protein 2-like [Oenanthe melanoleuca]|uniref:proline-rich protein 2-like n=1 Tax=Oenanthe melanoleuca TaxID=2939378 RepID=UPI0024C13DDA|nr:proline-rich protein 2-like [Oenanthe melanoleuca]